MGVIEGHRPVAHDAPPPEGVSLGEKVVVFHALPGVQPLQVRLVGHAAVDEEMCIRDRSCAAEPRLGFIGKR